VLAALGVNIEASCERVQQCLDQLGIGFCFAPQLHPAMKHVAAVRRKLAVPTIFNLLGPLCNPAGAPYQVLGVGKPHLHRLLAEALALVGIERAVVVCGGDGLDEVTLSDETNVIQINGRDLKSFRWTPSDFGLARAGRESMLVDGPVESATMIRRILEGEQGPPRDIVVINAAAAIWTAGAAPTCQEAAERAAAAIDSGAADLLLKQFAQLSHS
jgi:anthranilate phosphoribosyltransferase